MNFRRASCKDKWRRNITGTMNLLNIYTLASLLTDTDCHFGGFSYCIVWKEQKLFMGENCLLRSKTFQLIFSVQINTQSDLPIWIMKLSMTITCFYKNPLMLGQLNSVAKISITFYRTDHLSYHQSQYFLVSAYFSVHISHFNSALQCNLVVKHYNAFVH